jgi:hypothetical protein
MRLVRFASWISGLFNLNFRLAFEVLALVVGRTGLWSLIFWWRCLFVDNPWFDMEPCLGDGELAGIPVDLP